MFKVPVNFVTFALNFDLTPIEEDFLLHLVWKARLAIARRALLPSATMQIRITRRLNINLDIINTVHCLSK